MQFHHPHGFRQQVVDALLAEMPEIWDDLMAAGAEPVTLPEQPGQVIGCAAGVLSSNGSCAQPPRRSLVSGCAPVTSMTFAANKDTPSVSG
jgi:hypothetical protein